MNYYDQCKDLILRGRIHAPPYFKPTFPWRIPTKPSRTAAIMDYYRPEMVYIKHPTSYSAQYLRKRLREGGKTDKKGGISFPELVFSGIKSINMDKRTAQYKSAKKFVEGGFIWYKIAEKSSKTARKGGMLYNFESANVILINPKTGERKEGMIRI